MKKLILLFLLLTSCTSVEPRTVLPTQQLLAALPRLTITQNGRVLTDCKNMYSQIIIQADNVTLDGCSVINSNERAGAVLVMGQNNVVKNSYFSGNCRAGVVVHGQYNLLENNEVEKTRDCSGSDADGIRVLNSNNTVRGNYIHDLNPERAIFPHVDGIQGDFPNYQFKNIVIEDNIIDSFQAGIQSDGLACDNVTIRRNVIRGDRPLNMSCDNLKVTDNIFYGIGSVSFIGIRDGSSNVTFTGNTVCNTTEGIISKSVTFGGNNIFWNISGVKPRRDSGYSYVNGQLKYPSDSWQSVRANVCYSFPGGVNTPTAPTASQIPQISTVTTTPIPQTQTFSPATATASPTGEITATPTITLLPTFTASPTASRTPSRTPSPTRTPTPVCYPVVVGGDVIGNFCP